MPGPFLLALTALTEFIANHPEIEIGESVTSIPENVRQDFYLRFNSARTAFIEDNFPECLFEARRLQQEYSKAAADAADVLVLEDPPAANRFRRFLLDPVESLTRELFDPLFDLLKNRETVDSFERRSASRIRELFPALYRGAYEKWAVLSLVALLEINRAFRVPVRDLQPADRGKSGGLAPAEEIPVPTSAATCYFSQPLKSIFAVPDFILHSARLNRFISLRSEFKEGICRALNPSPARDWDSTDAELLQSMARGLTLVYAAENPESLSLIADATKFCRPDLVLWCVNAQSLGRDEVVEILRRAGERIKPTRGCFAIVNRPWPDTSAAEAPSLPEAPCGVDGMKIRVLTAGYDREKLLPVIAALEDVSEFTTAPFF